MSYASATFKIMAALCVSCNAFSASPSDDCDSYGGDHMGQVQCIARAIKKLDAEMNNTYKAALATLPEKDDRDRRKGREQLRKSQRAWLKYKEENCILIGGLEGGSNLWVTHFAAICEAEEIAARTKFLKGIANGTGRP